LKTEGTNLMPKSENFHCGFHLHLIKNNMPDAYLKITPLD